MTIDGTAINPLSERIIDGAFKVANALGTGFLEKVYENALAHELRKSGLRVRPQVGVAVHYDGVVVGESSADLLVEDIVIVELKAIKALDPVHVAQGLNYLRATGLPLCLPLNFAASRLQIRRLVLG